MKHTTIGIDVSKQKLDICIFCNNDAFTIQNTLSDFKFLIKKIKKDKLNVTRIVIEHTGGYQQKIVDYLLKNNFPVCVVSPSKVRHFAKAIGYLAKTDKIDAYVLAQYGEIIQPELTIIKEDTVKVLLSLVKHRKQLTDVHKQTKQWLEKQPDTRCKKRIENLQQILEVQLKQIRKEIKDFIKKHEILCKKYKLLCSVRGIGEDTAALLLAELSELGNISRQKIVALCGLAPINRDSGIKRGKAFIQGGRKDIRNYLYLCVMVCLKSKGVVHDYYDHLKSKGKPSKVALTACMRKLLIHLNAKLALVD